jgi:hypothetical protein
MVDLILAKRRFILTKAKVSEPRSDINGGAGATATADLSLASKFAIVLSRRIRCPNGMPSHPSRCRLCRSLASRYRKPPGSAGMSR